MKVDRRQACLNVKYTFNDDLHWVKGRHDFAFADITS